MIWIILALNILTVAIAFKKRMVLCALLNAVFLYIVTGQAFQIQGDLDHARSVWYLNNYINDLGFHLALWYVLGISCVSLVLSICLRGYAPKDLPPPTLSFAPSRGFYFLLFSFLCVCSFILVFLVVGLSQFLHSSRPGFQSGSTIFLVLLFLGTVPMLIKLLYRCRIERGDILCCLASFIVTGVFSRTDLLFFLVAMLLAKYYSGGWAEARVTVGLIARFAGFGIAAAFIVIGIGAIHSAENYVSGSLSDLVQFLLEHPEKSVLSIEYNYRVGVEGMSGIAGIFTQYLSYPNSIHHDYSASWVLQGMLQWLPGTLKLSARNLEALSAELNWYPFSVVATAAETFFMRFGWLATLVYPITLYVLCWYLPRRIMSAKLSPLSNVIGYVFMAWTSTLCPTAH